MLQTGEVASDFARPPAIDGEIRSIPLSECADGGSAGRYADGRDEQADGRDTDTAGRVETDESPESVRGPTATVHSNVIGEVVAG